MDARPVRLRRMQHVVGLGKHADHGKPISAASLATALAVYFWCKRATNA